MTKQLNIQVEDLHHEWIRRRAFRERLSMAEVVRNIINKAITDEYLVQTGATGNCRLSSPEVAE